VRAQDLTAAAVVAGAGLVRAGTTLDVVAHADGSIVVAADSVQVGVLATDAQHGTRGGAALHAIVTPTVAGFSSAADKTKLDTIATGADVTIAALAAAAVPVSVNAKRITNLGTPTAPTDAATRAYVDAAPPVPHASTHADGGSDELNVAGLSGLLADPQTAGSIKTATTTVAVAAAAAPAADQALMATSSTAAAWRVPPVATTSLPGYLSAADKLKLDGVATSAAAVGATAATQVTVTTAAPGAAVTAARSDHVHSVATGAPSGLTVGGVQAAGTSTALVRQDHVHAMPALVTASVDGFMAAGDKTRLDGMATSAAAVGSTAASQITVATAASGAATTAARSDHVHSVATAAPAALTVGAASSAGVAVTLNRSDHVHAMPGLATGAADGFMSQGDFSKLAGVEAGAQVTSFARVQTALAAATSAVGVNNQRLSSVASPTADTDAYTRGYAKAAWLGKAPVRAASTATINFATTAPTVVDGVTLVVGDRVLVKDGGDGNVWEKNGIYTVQVLGTGSNGTWVRASDADTSDKLQTGATVDVLAGTVNGGRTYEIVSSTQAHTPIDGGVAVNWSLVMSPADKAKLDGISSGAAALSSTLPAIVDTAAGDAGTGNTASRIDHRHQVRVGSPVALTVGAAAANGTSSSLVRADHVHAMPGLATGAADGFMALGDFTKLGGIEAGAQVTSFARVQTALAAASSAVSINAQRLSSVADPSAAQDAATKAYVDAIAQGLDIKASVRLVATTNVAALTGNVSIDGSTTAPGQRVLLAGQTTASANGIYLTAAGAWARTTDADTSAKVTAGMYVFATEGAANADSGWALITPDPIVLGTTALTFTQVTGAGQITAGAGLTKSGNTLDVVAHADGSIVVAADTVQVGVLATDAQHGTRGGGTLHAAVIAAGAAGFMSGADKTKLDGMATGAASVGSAAASIIGAPAAVGVATTAARSDHAHSSDYRQSCRVRYASFAAPTAGAMPLVIDGITLSVNDRVLVKVMNAAAGGVFVVTTPGTGNDGTWTKANNDFGTYDYIGIEAGAFAGTIWSTTDGNESYPVGSPDWRGSCRAKNNGSANKSAAPLVVDGVTLVAGDTVLDNQGICSVASPGTGSNGVWNLQIQRLTLGSLVFIREGTTYGGSLWKGSGPAFNLDPTTLAVTDNFHGALSGGTLHPDATTTVSGFFGATDKVRLDGMATGAAAVGGVSPTTLLAGTVGTVGSAATAARSDHTHVLSVSTPAALTVGGSAAAGSSGNFNRADHVHAMPAIATSGAAGFLSSADKSKLDGIGINADATLATLAGALGAVSINSQRLTAVAAPTGNTDAINKLYLDNILLASPKPNGCRLGGHAANPVMPADNATCTTLYFLPWVSDIIYLLVNGVQWLPCRIPTNGLSLALSGLTVGRPYDVFIVAPTTWSPSPATYTMELLAWTSTASRASALQNQGGFYTLGSDPTRRYVGTIYARAANSFAYMSGTASVTAKCDIWNAENRVHASLYGGASFSASGVTVAAANTWQGLNANTKLETVIGLNIGEPIDMLFDLGILFGGGSGGIGTGLDTMTAIVGNNPQPQAASTSDIHFVRAAQRHVQTVNGAHFLSWLIRASSTTTVKFFYQDSTYSGQMRADFYY
jgi:hypothetical protein